MTPPARLRSRAGLIALCALAGALAAGPPAAARGAASPLDEARARMLAGDRAAARAQIDSLLAVLEPEAEAGAEARLLRARLEEDGPAYAAALRELLATEEDPRRAASLRLSLGQALFAEGRLEDALAEFREARELGRGEAGSLWEGLTALALGDGPAAREALRQAVASGNRAVRQRALLALGDTERLSGDCRSAVARYEEAREVPHGAQGWWAAAAWAEARCRDELGDRDRAAEMLREILRRAPSSYEAPVARARLLAWNAPEPEPAAPTAESTESAGPSPAPGFAVQVGAFTLADNAKSLAEAVEGRGFGPVRVVRGEDRLHRVLVGRFPAREQAEALGDSLGITLGVGFSVVTDREE